ncbi:MULTISPECIES: DUF350 domain-containing protein [unclassified Parafrankia]|uniref:DUF350 domain-containing protein n=1 Tax=unclassified Parafrankia TaxID=2994368 RepID=UPI000DA5B021|nr:MULTISPECIES: DUF350 domain-containing protein [unclassified Parafrankia]TCJ37746.1 DUF350 domain-containing protein [Parafrankia sp. BMG5.11]SQD96780.1 conserved membrane hypothetical protein [Parafrankia sp. Ea1.12]
MTFGSLDAGDLGEGIAATLLYFLVGVGVLALGFLVLDLLTPGNLRRQVYVDRRPNAAVLLAGNHLSLTVIVVTAVLTSSDSLAQGLVDSAVYGLVGVALQALALRVLDAVVPGHLRAIVDEPTLSPAAWAVATSLLAIGAVNAAALS